MINVLHISQTDIRYDSRILKEMISLKNSDLNLNIYGIGAELENTSHKEASLEGLIVDTIKLKSREINFPFKFIRRTFSVIEIMFKMFFKGLRHKPQIVHCHDTPTLPLGILLKIFTRAKIIYDAHELESNRNDLPKTTGKLVLLVEKLFWPFIESLIVVSPSIDKWYQKNLGEKKTSVIMNSPFYEISNISEERNYLREFFSIDRNCKIFIYVGGLQQGRGLDVLINVFKQKDISSHLVFLGYGHLKEKIEIICNEYNNIHLHDAVAHDKVVTIAKSADVGLCFIQNVSLSDYYCLPNKLFEYAFSNIPVLASDFPDISKTVKKYNLGKCSSLEFNSIYSAIKEYELMDDLPEINSDELFQLSWEAQEKKLINLYDMIINKIKR